MTLGLVRYHESNHAHFVTFSCYRRMRLLTDNSTRDLFLEELERTRLRFGMCIYGYVLMPEHVHLLLSEPDVGSLADAIRCLKLCISKRARATATKDKNSRLWQARYYDRNTRDYEEFREKLKYIHRNPVKRGLCDRPEDWKWSSFLHYATGVVGPVEIESAWTARRRELDGFPQHGIP